jgi:hypothetical protein
MLRMLGYFAAWALIAGGYSVGITLVVVAAKSITLTIPLGAGWRCSASSSWGSP